MPEPAARSDPSAQGTPGLWARGGGWVVAQLLLAGLALVAAWIGPRLPTPVRRVSRLVGAPVLGLGALTLLLGTAGLGRNLTPFPMPKSDATLVQDGAYGYVRHPIYSGIVLGVIGWALLGGRWAGLLAALAVGVFFDAKASREEGWLIARFPEYPAYRRRVRKLIPYVY